ncbi:MAG: twin-arginine translocase subunit TatC [Acidobacteria bacterium]|nr:twin-arginine translocase subunit TatC [Acidobacteriota bacterium]MCW5970104.1 twin-arginine translocase subunit TatC [Blastocatellales bacterium]
MRDEHSEDGLQMSFLDHLDELRRRLVYSVMAIGAAFVVCFALSGYIFDFLSIPIGVQVQKAEKARRALGGAPNLDQLKEGDQFLYVLAQDELLGGVRIPVGMSAPARVISRDGRLTAVTAQPLVVNKSLIPADTEITSVFGEAVLAPGLNGLIVTTVQGAFTLYMRVALYAAIAFAVPFLFYQLWAFVAPGLYSHEKKYIVPVLVTSSLFFILGAAFAYKIAFPAACDYLIGLQIAGGFQTLINAEDYFDLILIIMLGLGLVFQIPVIAFVLGRIGLITPGMLWRSWRYAIVIIAILSALLTPTADAFNMMIFAAPMLSLYFFSILVVWIFGKPRRTDEEVTALKRSS